MQKIILSSLFAICVLSNLSAQTQVITNDVTISITYAYEAYRSQKGSIYITPAPIVKTVLTKDLISQMKQSYPSIISTGAKLQVLIDTNNNVTPQVKNTNSTVVDVSGIMHFKLGDNSLYSGSYNSSNKASADNDLNILQMVYDDTSINKTNGISFSFQALSYGSIVSSPTTTNGIFAVKTTFSVTGGIGDGFALYSNVPSSVIIKNASMKVTGSGLIDTSK